MQGWTLIGGKIIENEGFMYVGTNSSLSVLGRLSKTFRKDTQLAKDTAEMEAVRLNLYIHTACSTQFCVSAFVGCFVATLWLS